jgi:HEAT repeat protein
MDIEEIKASLTEADFQRRLQAIAALKAHDAEVAVPLLISKKRDPEFLVRSFVAMGLGKQLTAESFTALLEMMQFDRDTNVQSQAADSLSLFGQVAVPYLVTTFHQNKNWLVRLSILAAIAEMGCPDELLEVCVEAFDDQDATVQEAAVETLAFLQGTNQQQAALSHLVKLASSASVPMRIRVATTLKQFDDPEAKATLAQLRQDPDHQVVAAALEDLIS